jgi:hypothetical protein
MPTTGAAAVPGGGQQQQAQPNPLAGLLRMIFMWWAMANRRRPRQARVAAARP